MSEETKTPEQTMALGQDRKKLLSELLVQQLLQVAYGLLL
jgi:hypothetical protein